MPCEDFFEHGHYLHCCVVFILAPFIKHILLYEINSIFDKGIW
jgi:hypothetical protein